MKISKGKALILTCILSSSIAFSTDAYAGSSSSQSAVKLGNELTTQLNEFNRIISSGNIAIINMKYDSLSNKIKQTEKAIGKVSGSANRKALQEKYVRNAKIARERVIYEVSQFRLLDTIDAEIANGNTSNVSSKLAKLTRLKERAKGIKAAGGYQSLPSLVSTSLTDWESDLRNYKNSSKENITKLNEVEPNDEDNTAMNISSGALLTGALDKDDLKDTYAFNVEKSGEVRVILAMDEGSFSVYDQNGIKVASDYTASTIDVDPGTYYVKVVGGYYSLPKYMPYQLKVTYPSATYNQTNDTLQSATKIQNGYSYSDSIDIAADVDYYKLEVTGPGQIEVYQDWNNDYTELSIRNQFGTVLESSEYNAQITFEAESAGTYYVAVRGTNDSYKSSKPYRINVSFPSNKTYFNSEFEGNETFANAMPILTNIVYSNKIKSYYDDDIFKVSLKQGKAFVFGEDIGIRIFDKYGNLIDEKPGYISTEYEVEIPKTDTYYVSLKGFAFPTHTDFIIKN